MQSQPTLPQTAPPAVNGSAQALDGTPQEITVTAAQFAAYWRIANQQRAQGLEPQEIDILIGAHWNTLLRNTAPGQAGPPANGSG